METKLRPLALPYVLTIIEKDWEKVFKQADEVWEQQKDVVEGEGFEKGKVPRSYAEKKIGVGTLYKAIFEQLLVEGVNACEQKVVDVSQWRIDLFEPKQPVIMSAEVYLTPKVICAQYSNVAVELDPVIVKDSEVEATIQRIRTNNANYSDVDGTICKGHIATLDFVGKIDGKPYPGGEAKDLSIEVGGKDLIPEFENQLVGKKVGDEWTFTTVLPANMVRKDMAGKSAEFTVKILKIKERTLPDIADPFAVVLGYKDVESMQQQLRDDIYNEKAKIREQYKEAEVLRKIVLGMQCEPLPDRMVTDEIESMFNDMIRAMNITPEDYFKRTGTTKQQYSNEHWHQAASYVKSRLLLQYVADQEKVQTTDQDIQEAIERLAKKQKVAVEELKNKVNVRNLELQVRAVKAHQIVMSTAKVIDKSPKSPDKLKHLKDLVPKENQDKASTVFGRDEDKKIIKLGKK